MKSTSLYISHFNLERSDAVTLVTSIIKSSIKECASMASTTHHRAFLPPLFELSGDDIFYGELRAAILELSSEFGYPSFKKDVALFDAELGNYLVNELKISPADAGREEPWNFISLVVFPDVIKWRFSNKNCDPEYDRWIGKPRNVFRKAWWKAYSLGPKLNSQLGEDEGVALMERSVFGKNPSLVQAIAETHIARKEQFSHDFSLNGSSLLRILAFRLRVYVPFINLDALSQTQIHNLCNEIYDSLYEDLISKKMSTI